jgi:hypothetical protein
MYGLIVDRKREPILLSGGEEEKGTVTNIDGHLRA